MSDHPKPLIFASAAYTYLRDRICTLTGAVAARVDVKTFPDGERYLRLETDVAERDVVIVAGTVSDTDTLMLYDLACGVVAAGARRLTLIIPYFGYATMERVGKEGEIVTAKTRAQLLSSIPAAAGGNSVLLLDLHSEGIPHYFEGGLRPVHLYARPVVLGALRRLGGDSFVLGCTDAGRAKWVESLANSLGVPAAFVFKRRIDAETTEVAALSGSVQGHRVLIYDDMIRTGSSLLRAAEAYRAAGATELAAVTTHGVFPRSAWKHIEDSGMFTRVVCTDSHPRALEIVSPLLQVDTVAGVFADYLMSRRLA